MNSSRPSASFLVLGFLLLVAVFGTRLRSRVYSKAGLEYAERLRKSPYVKRIHYLLGLLAGALVVVGTILLLIGD